MTSRKRTTARNPFFPRHHRLLPATRPPCCSQVRVGTALRFRSPRPPFPSDPSPCHPQSPAFFLVRSTTAARIASYPFGPHEALFCSGCCHHGNGDLCRCRDARVQSHFACSMSTSSGARLPAPPAVALARRRPLPPDGGRMKSAPDRNHRKNYRRHETKHYCQNHVQRRRDCRLPRRQRNLVCFFLRPVSAAPGSRRYGPVGARHFLRPPPRSSAPQAFQGERRCCWQRPNTARCPSRAPGALVNRPSKYRYRCFRLSRTPHGWG